MAGIVNLLTRVLTSTSPITTGAVAVSRGNNPFSSNGNPFVTHNNSNPFAYYGQNRPVVGGYFAGYYNNQPNIVGRKLFIEV